MSVIGPMQRKSRAVRSKVFSFCIIDATVKAVLSKPANSYNKSPIYNDSKRRPCQKVGHPPEQITKYTMNYLKKNKDRATKTYKQ